MIDFSLYKGREQTWVKHFLLSEYLQRFAPIIGSWCSTITYVDCFSGPWMEKSVSLQDTSFSIALAELRRSRQTLRERFNRELVLRAFFVEKDPEAYRKLKGFADQVTDVEIKTRPSELENCIQDIVAFVKAGKQKNFPFLFIDPTGWTGFSLNAIEPLLKLNPGEVMINFMTGHILWLIEQPEESQREGFAALYGPSRHARVLERIRGKTGIEREDILVSEYMEAIRETGHYKHVSSAVVLNPAMDRTHFHLVYGTRHARGLEVFKGAEKKAMDGMVQARAAIQDRKADAGQGAFEFRGKVPKLDRHYNNLRSHYASIAKDRVLRNIRTVKRIPYDLLYAMALAVPLTFESDLKKWIAGWEDEESIRIEGLKPKARKPQIEEGHFIVWAEGQGKPPAGR